MTLSCREDYLVPKSLAFIMSLAHSCDLLLIQIQVPTPSFHKSLVHSHSCDLLHTQVTSFYQVTKSQLFYLLKDTKARCLLK